MNGIAKPIKKNKKLSKNKLWKNFSDSIMNGWSEKHEIILKSLIQHEQVGS